MNEDRTFDFFKHLTTLNFAAIAFLMVAFEQNLVKFPKEQAFPETFATFTFSLICSLFMMLCTMRNWNLSHEANGKRKKSDGNVPTDSTAYGVSLKVLL